MTTATILKPCLDCGVAADCQQGRCHSCFREREAAKERAHGPRERPTRTDRTGPTSTAWKKLRARAVAMQPWCSDCRQTKAQVEARGSRLEVDHLPSAWAKSMQHKPIELIDVDVVCREENQRRGPSGPGSQRWEEWERSQHD